MCPTRYRRFTISPSPATKISSPCERKTFLGSPGRLAKPKNFKLMGGGGGGGGGPIGLATKAGATCFGGSGSALKIFLPVPLYCVDSLARNKSSRSEGSSVLRASD